MGVVVSHSFGESRAALQKMFRRANLCGTARENSARSATTEAVDFCGRRGKLGRFSAVNVLRLDTFREAPESGGPCGVGPNPDKGVTYVG